MIQICFSNSIKLIRNDKNKYKYKKYEGNKQKNGKNSCDKYVHTSIIESSVFTLYP